MGISDKVRAYTPAYGTPINVEGLTNVEKLTKPIQTNEQKDLDILTSSLVRVTVKESLRGLDTANRNFPGYGFEDLPEYQEAVDALNKYADAVRRHCNKLIEGEKNE